jgi:hypothetical protein
MTRARALTYGIWEFVVGDDPWTALGVVLALSLTATVTATGASAWWVMPPAVVGLLVLSVWRAARRRV